MKNINLLRELLLNIIDNIDAGNSNVPDEEQCEQLIDIINKLTNTKNKFSKYRSYRYLGLSRSTFDRYVKDGIIPEGRKESGFKEKFWYKSDLDVAKNKIKKL